MRKSRHSKRQNEQKSRNVDFENNPYAAELEVPFKTKLYVGIFIGALLLVTVFVFFSNDIINKQNSDTMLERVLNEEQTILERKEEDTSNEELATLVAQADSVYQMKDYFAAVFFYRQALALDETNIDLHEKMVASLKASCDNGHELHCSVKDGAEKKMNDLKQLYRSN